MPPYQFSVSHLITLAHTLNVSPEASSDLKKHAKLNTISHLQVLLTPALYLNPERPAYSLSWAWATLRDHAIDYWRLRICINKIKITDYKDHVEITGQAYEITTTLRTPRLLPLNQYSSNQDEIWNRGCVRFSECPLLFLIYNYRNVKKIKLTMQVMLYPWMSPMKYGLY